MSKVQQTVTNLPRRRRYFISFCKTYLATLDIKLQFWRCKMFVTKNL